MISKLIIDNGGLFNSWEPYANLTSFTYHYGFHSAVAVYHWITGLPVERAMLWTGQIINICAIFSLYPLAILISKNRWAGVIAMLIAGLLSPMPMAYVNWGRYTQLAGQVILSVAIWLVWSILDDKYPDWQNITWVKRLTNWRYLGLSWRVLAITWIAVAGIALTHYRILILFILFFPAYLLITSSRKKIFSMLGRILWIGIGGITLSSPWFIRLLGGRLLQGFVKQVTTLPSKVSINKDLFQGINNFQSYLPIFIWIFFILCIIWSLIKQKKGIEVITLWWLVILFATNPSWVRLPGSGVISNFAIFIAMYIPASLVIASAFTWISSGTRQQEAMIDPTKNGKAFRLIFPVAALIIVCVCGLWGFKERTKDLNTARYELVTRPDLRAMKWIQENTTRDDIFLVSSFFAYNDSLAVGSDAGWWIPMLAERKTTLPPLTYGIEEGSQIDDFQETNDLNRQVITKGITNPDVISMLRKNGIKYIYIGQRHGTVNYNGPTVLDPQVIIGDENFKLRYNQDRVWIFELMQ
jgi:hypothetical protein